MIVTERDMLAQKEYYRDQMRAAERYHLARRARAERDPGAGLMAKAWAWLGDRYAAWSTRSQESYEPVGSSAVPQPR
jgi:hypothetical protein